MWWVIGGVVAVILIVAFISWLVHEMINAPIFSEDDEFSQLLDEEGSDEEIKDSKLPN